MGTISQKLNRVKQTKSKLKDAINIGGGQITDDTIFNNYADEIKDIYMDAINNGVDNIYNSLPKTTKTGSKIELDTEEGKMKITLKGDTQQNSTSGINLIHFSDVLETTVNGITYSIQDDVISLNGTATDNVRYIYASNFAFDGAGDYRITLIPISGNYTTGVIGISSRNEDKTQQIVWQQVASGAMSNKKTYTEENISLIKNIGLYINSGSVLNNLKFKFMFTKGDTTPSTYENMNSPTLDYPQDIKVVTGEQNIVIRKSALPNEYTQVDYIKSSGTQYIDSGVLPSENIGFEIDFIPHNDMAIGGSKTIFGSRKTWKSNGYQLTTYTEGNLNGGHFLFGTNDTVSNIRHSAYMQKNVRCQISFLNDVFRMANGNETNIQGTFSNVSKNIYLFGNIENINPFELSTTTLYSLKFYDNGNLIRDFIPCYRNSDNEVGLYDIVNNIFYINQGTGTFTYGKEIDIKEQNYPITLISKNLALNDDPNNPDANYCSSGNGSAVIQYDGTENSFYTTTSRLRDFKLEKGKTYTFSLYIKRRASSNAYIYYYYYNSINNSHDVQGVFGVTDDYSRITKTFTIPDNYDGFSIIVYSGVYFKDIQLEEGSTATNYTPYYNLEYCKIGDYADEFIRTSGKNLFNKDKIKLNYT